MAGIGSILSWHIGLAGDGTPSFGAVHNHTDNSTNEGFFQDECYALAGHGAGGPFWGPENAGGNDIHVYGSTKDGKLVSPVHIPTLSLFHLLEKDRQEYFGKPYYFDGPLHFEEDIHNLPNRQLPYDCRSHISWEPYKLSHYHQAYGVKNGRWYVWTECASGGSDEPKKPPKDPPPPPKEPVPKDVDPPPKEPVNPPKYPPYPPIPPAPVTPPSDPIPKPSDEVTVTTTGGGTSGYTDTNLQHSFPSIKMKGNPTHAGAPNFGDYRIQNSPEDLDKRRYNVPVSGILTAIYPYKNGQWHNANFTNKPRGRGGNGKYLSGDSNGGFWLRPAVSDKTSIWRLKNGHPDWINDQSTWIGISPNSYLFFGYPDPETALPYSDSTIKSWSLKIDSSNDLNFERWESGAVANTLTLPTGVDGELTRKKDKTAYFPAPHDSVYSDHPVVNLGNGDVGNIGIVFPDDFSSLTSLVLRYISDSTDATVPISISTEWGAYGEQHNNDTGSGSTNLNTSAGRIDELDISSYFSGGVASDQGGFAIRNNDASTQINLLGIKMVYTPTK